MAFNILSRRPGRNKEVEVREEKEGGVLGCDK